MLESLGIDRLTVPERIALARAIWDSIADDAETAALASALQPGGNRLATGSWNPWAAARREWAEAAVPAPPVRAHGLNLDEHLAAIRDVMQLTPLIRDHGLNPDEVVRLVRVLWEYDPAARQEELAEELRGILAARELAAKAPLTAEAVDRARDAFTSGRVPFVHQDMD